MNNELTNSSNASLPATQNAEKIVNVERVDSINQTNQYYMMGALPGLPGSAPTPALFSHDFYNLFVYGQVPFHEPGHITFDKERCLMNENYIDPDLKRRFSSLSEEAIAELKTFPCSIACENRHYGWTDEDHYAAIGQLLDVKIRSNGIEVYFHPHFAVSQARLSELAPQLGLGNVKKYNEFNHSHWTVKAIDLLEVINDAGLNPYGRR